MEETVRETACLYIIFMYIIASANVAKKIFGQEWA
jgi:hypothetical protein